MYHLGWGQSRKAIDYDTYKRADANGTVALGKHRCALYQRFGKRQARCESIQAAFSGLCAGFRTPHRK